MTNTMNATTNTLHDEIVERPGERGSALLAVLLLLLMMAALAAALGVNGQTETLVSRNQRAATQATVAAEAGLNHAVELATTYISQWKANGFADVDSAVDALLLGPDLASGTVATDADNGSLGTRVGITFLEELPIGTRMTITGGINADYEAFVMDDDATAPDEPTGDLYADENSTLIVRATGYAQDNTKVVLEALIGPLALPAVLVNGDLTMSGNTTIDGSVGSVHSNGDLDINGNSVAVSGTITASGTYTGSNAGSGGAPQLPVPEIRASDYLDYADFILTSSGTVTQPDATVVCDASTDLNACRAGHGWTFKGADGWESYGEAATNRTFYVQGKVAIGNDGSVSNPLQITVIAEGSIDINANSTLMPDTSGLMFVTDGDLSIRGNSVVGDALTNAGQILVHEQLEVSGTPSIGGQLIVENATSVDSLVTANAFVNGTPTITYNGGLGSSTFSVTGWRDVRDDD